LLGLVRFSRAPQRLLQTLAVALTLAELWHYQHRLLKTIPEEVYRNPPPIARALLPPRDRLYVQSPQKGEPDLFRPDGRTETAVTRAKLARLEPYSALLWGFAYEFHQDYDLMLTRWARRALTAANAQPG